MKFNKRSPWLTYLVLFGIIMIIASGCGPDEPEAPLGSSLTFLPDDVSYTQPAGEQRQIVKVYVRDPRGNPMNGVKVTIDGGFAYPFDPALYYFYDTKGNQLTSPFVAETGDYGALYFEIRIPAVVSSNVTPPSSVGAAEVVGGGFLPVGVYSYVITALKGISGETTASPTATCTIATLNSACSITWTPVQGADGYNIYGRTAGSLEWMQTVSGQASASYTDDGLLSLPTTTPIPVPTTNTATGPFANSFTDSVHGFCGTAYGSMDISFN